MVLATVVSALGALGALWFARDTVRETRAMRREERLARLPELVAELGETATLIRQDPFQRELYEVRRLRLAAMLKGTPEELPSSNVLADHDGPTSATDSTEPYITEVQDALMELAERLAERRGDPPRV